MLLAVQAEQEQKVAEVMLSETGRVEMGLGALCLLAAWANASAEPFGAGMLAGAGVALLAYGIHVADTYRREMNAQRQRLMSEMQRDEDTGSHVRWP